MKTGYFLEIPEYPKQRAICATVAEQKNFCDSRDGDTLLCQTEIDSFLPIVMPSIASCQLIYRRSHPLQPFGQFQNPANPMRWNDTKKTALDHQIRLPTEVVEVLSVTKT